MSCALRRAWRVASRPDWTLTRAIASPWRGKMAAPARESCICGTGLHPVSPSFLARRARASDWLLPRDVGLLLITVPDDLLGLSPLPTAPDVIGPWAVAVASTVAVLDDALRDTIMIPSCSRASLHPPPDQPCFAQAAASPDAHVLCLVSDHSCTHASAHNQSGDPRKTYTTPVNRPLYVRALRDAPSGSQTHSLPLQSSDAVGSS